MRRRLTQIRRPDRVSSIGWCNSHLGPGVKTSSDSRWESFGPVFLLLQRITLANPTSRIIVFADEPAHTHQNAAGDRTITSRGRRGLEQTGLPEEHSSDRAGNAQRAIQSRPLARPRAGARPAL